MELQRLHPWTLTPEEAREVQRRLAPQIVPQDESQKPWRTVGGVDLSPEDDQGYTRAGLVVLSLPGLEVVEAKVAKGKPGMPYVPGLLAFREVPVIAEALEQLQTTPDLLLVDGHGLAHPRHFGVACHIGLLTDVPTIGCAKSVLLGVHGALGWAAGAWTQLFDGGEVVGAAVRTKRNVTPIYVSIGHKVGLTTAVQAVLECCKGYRMPEPTRLAHLAAAGRLGAT